MFITAILWCFRDSIFYFAINEKRLALTGGLILIISFLSKEMKSLN